MDTDPLAPPADSRAVGHDLHSVLFPQKSYIAASVLPTGVLPSDLPASVMKSDKAAGAACYEPRIWNVLRIWLEIRWP
jgi:hypothetical protein